MPGTSLVRLPVGPGTWVLRPEGLGVAGWMLRFGVAPADLQRDSTETVV